MLNLDGTSSVIFGSEEHVGDTYFTLDVLWI